MSTQNPTVNTQTNISLPYEDQLRIKEMFVNYLKSEEPKPRTILELNSIFMQFGARVAREARDSHDLEQRINDYKTTFGIKEVTKRDLLIICNNGVAPSNPEMLARAEERYKRYISNKIKTKTKESKNKPKSTETVSEE